MTIDEAIRILKLDAGRLAYERQTDKAQAKKLGIEALKRVKASRDKKFPVLGEELPGETKD